MKRIKKEEIINFIRLVVNRRKTITETLRKHLIPGKSWDFSSFPPHSDQLWGPPSLLSN
jgi:hypothetical protein